MADIAKLRGNWFRVTGETKGREFSLKYKPSEKAKRTCSMCGKPVRRSWITQILHSKCRTCRYLVMMYGPSISVTLVEE